MASNTIDVDALREQFPGLTHHPTQPRWDVAKVVIRSISIFLAAVACVELITLSFAPSSGASRYTMGAVFVSTSFLWPLKPPSPLRTHPATKRQDEREKQSS